MADTMKQLGQLDPSAGALSALYTVPASTMAVVSSVTICNRNTFDVTFRVSIAIAGAADDPKQYRYYDTALAANETFVATIGITLATTDVIRVRSDRGGVSFAADGVEVT